VCNPLLAWEVAGQGHNDGVMILFTLLFVVALQRGRPWAAGAWLLLALAAKTAMLPVAFFFALSCLGPVRARGYVVLCVTGCLALVALWWAYPSLALPLGYAVSAPAAARRLMNSIPALIFTTAQLRGDRLALAAYRTYWLGALLVVVAVAIAYGRKMTDGRAVIEYGFRFLLLLVLVFSPNLQPWYFAWPLPLAAFSENAGLQRFLVLASAAFLALYPALQTIPAGITAAALLTILIVRYRRNLGPDLGMPGSPTHVVVEGTR